MATYVVPQVLVFQEVLQSASPQIQPLPAHLAGGHAQLIRFTEADEQVNGLLGDYDPLSDTAYNWPERPVGGLVDADYTRVYIKDALLRYFAATVGSGDTIQTVSGKLNRVRASATNFKDNGDYPLADDFQGRDVQIGDVAKLRAVVGSDVHEMCTYVAGFAADPVAAVVNAASADSDNQGTVSNSDDFEKVAGADNCVELDSVDSASYSGLVTGRISEVYRVRVTQASVGGDATTARLRVTSASGDDDQSNVVPAAFGAATAIGSQGLTATFTNDSGGACSVSAVEDGISTDDFLVGQEWEIEVTQAYTAVTATSAGTYAGNEDDTYVIECTRGGVYSNNLSTCPQITVRTTRGTDISGPHNVTAAALAIAIGTQGVTVAFNQTKLAKGERFYVEVSAEADGPFRTLILGNNFSDEVIDNGETEVDLELFIRKTIEVPANRTNAAPLTNWEQSATEITLQSGITAFDSSWTDEAGEPEALPVYSACGYGQVFVTARYWLSTLCGAVNKLSLVGDLDDAVSGPLHPDNPLKYGLLKALQNSNGREVTYTAICDPNDVDEWARMLELIDGRRDVYGLVPLTRNKLVWSLYEAHVGGQSSPEFGRWRTVWCNTEGIPELAVVNSDLSADEAEVLAVLEDDPDTSGTQYTRLRVPAGNGQFVTNDVAPGDIVRALYTTDGFGNVAYTEFVVDAVINQDTLRLFTGHTAAINVPEKIEIWRSLTATQQSAELAKTWGYTNRRIRMVWPDELAADGYTVPGYFLCAALAGLVSAVLPHAGLTRMEIAGFTSLPRTTSLFSRSQLNTMAAGGVWIVTQDLETGTVFTRHAVTTGDTDIITDREEMLVRNLDSISYFFLDLYDPYIGISNVTPSALGILRAETRAGLKFLESANYTVRLGPQLITGELVELRAHAILRDRAVSALRLTLPFPLNNVEAHLQLVV